MNLKNKLKSVLDVSYFVNNQNIFQESLIPAIASKLMWTVQNIGFGVPHFLK